MKVTTNRLDELLAERNKNIGKIKVSKNMDKSSTLQDLFLNYDDTKKCVSIFENVDKNLEELKYINKDFFCLPFAIIFEMDDNKKLFVPWKKEMWQWPPSSEDFCKIADGYLAKKATFICQTEPFDFSDKYGISQSDNLCGQNGYYLDDIDAVIIEREANVK